MRFPSFSALVGLRCVRGWMATSELWQSFSRTELTTRPQGSDRPEECLPVPRVPRADCAFFNYLVGCLKLQKIEVGAIRAAIAEG